MPSAAEATSYHCRPESEDEIVQLAQQTLLQADCVDILPTPIDRLYEKARVAAIDLPSVNQIPSLRLTVGGRKLLNTAMQKIRGIADLRRRAVYIPAGDTDSRRVFAKAHELGHQLIPWHRVGRDCIDTNSQLRTDVREIFEMEANLFGSEIIFQGKHFRRRARDYKATPDAIFLLADQHGASRQATLWKFTEEQDVPVASLVYYPNRWTDELRLWKPVASPSFRRKYSDLYFPERIEADHPWKEARVRGEQCEGNIKLTRTTGRQESFTWHAWWNFYCLFVLLRVRPPLRRLL